MGESRRFAYFALILYTLCAVAAVWFPLTVALVTAATWIFWLIYGLRRKTHHPSAGAARPRV
jgi:Flp pilus assembly protein TadB